MDDQPQPCATTLTDAHPDFNGKLPIRLAVSSGGVSIYAEGYGQHDTAEGHGTPVFLELYRSELRLVVWADINDGEPSHVIPLGGAREACRRPEDGE